MHSANKKAFFGNSVFEVSPNVYEPAEDSFLFAENLHVKQGGSVLDMGTGTGILGILAAVQESKVVAVDVNPYAIRCAKHNSVRNKVRGQMSFLQGDLFESFNETARFDVILFNSPYLPTEKEEDTSWLSRAWAGGATGRQVIDRFIEQAPNYLNHGGELLLMQSNLANLDETEEKLSNSGMKTQIVASMNLPFFETLTLLKAKFNSCF